MSVQKGRLLGIGVGPGDPELITLKALRLLQSAAGKVFTESQTYSEHAGRVCGRVVLTQRNADTFGADIKKMNTARLTASEVRESEKFNVMEKQRIKVVFRDLFEQLDNVNW